MLHMLPPRKCPFPQFPQDPNKALTPVAIPLTNLPSLPSKNQFVPDPCSFHKELTPNFSPNPDLGCSLPLSGSTSATGHLGICPKQRLSAKLCCLTGTAPSKTQMCGFWFLETIKRNKSGCFSLSTGRGMIFPSTNGGAFPYIYISSDDVKAEH